MSNAGKSFTRHGHTVVEMFSKQQLSPFHALDCSEGHYELKTYESLQKVLDLS